MAKAKKVVKNSSLLLAILFILLGVGLIVGGFGAAANLGSILFTVLGIILIVFGVLSAVTGLLPVAFVEILVGVVLIVFSWTLIKVVFLVIGIFLLLTGVLGLLKNKKDKIIYIIDLVIGLLLVLRFVGAGITGDWVKVALDVLTYIAGGLLVFDGVLMLIGKKR
ncbi:MAG: DUF308 domain-containing protein [Bacilli bacterium]|nr:DUF308 domain-containing protein [Bacilli bacterium]